VKERGWRWKSGRDRGRKKERGKGKGEGKWEGLVKERGSRR